MRLIFGSSNSNKAIEIQSILPKQIEIQTLSDLNFQDDIPETATTIEGNALLKAEFVFKKWNRNCFADDSGLVIDALNGEPGVFSARYAGENRDDKANIQKVLENLRGITNRKAAFVTVIALYWNNQRQLFTGTITGTIADTPKGIHGFGYDPIFIPDNTDKTFAEMTLEDKSKLSHRYLAISKMREYIENNI